MDSIPEKRCTKCGVIKPTTDFSPRPDNASALRSWCKPCMAANARASYKRDPERGKANTRKRRSKKADEERQRMKAYNREYYLQNRDRVLARVQQYTQANHERLHPSRQKARINRRMREAGATGTHTTQQWESLCLWFGSVCLKCQSNGPLTRDHVIPLSRSGSNGIENLQPLCDSCNKSKGTNMTDYRNPNRLRAFLDRMEEA